MGNKTSLQDLLHELAEVRHLDFRGYKPSSLERRLRKRMAQLNVGDYGEYRDYLRENPAEVNDLLSTVLINVTEFFRDPPAWDALRRRAFPILFDGLAPGGSFRAWCAGCASGEEVYTLAILLAEHFGPRLKDYEIKIYATDNDGDALNVARRAEYPADRLRRVSPELREKYFTGSTGLLRVNREVRRLAIFGRSNLVNDAPISHVKLLVCRNVLIYFDTALQRQVLERFRYALDEDGVLFLGKSESQLQTSNIWRPIDHKWRIFQRINGGPEHRHWQEQDEIDWEKARKEYESLRTYQRHLLETIRPGVLILDDAGVITTGNDAAVSLWGLAPMRLTGLRLANTPLVSRYPELSRALTLSQAGNETTRFQATVDGQEGEKRVLAVTVRPILDESGNRTGTLIYADDVTIQEKLRSTIAELESTAEELHSANEELETTNEELQSTNEELETTNEELQSTNEELETTNEELQSLNEELETANTELEVRTRELDGLNEHFSQTLSQMPMPVVVLNQEMRIELWNEEAEKLFGMPSKSVVGLNLTQMPLDPRLRKLVVKRARIAAHAEEPRMLRRQPLHTDSFRGRVDIHFTPLAGVPAAGVMLLFEPARSQADKAAARRVPSVRRDPAKRRPAPRTKPPRRRK